MRHPFYRKLTERWLESRGVPFGKMRRALPGLLLALSVSIAPLASAQKKSELPSSTNIAAITTAPPTEQAPTITPAPKEVPPTVPQVKWEGGLLSINTDNSTLADILDAVREHTGADIVMPEGASSQRMAARLGPGPVREVLSSLLSWTGFNYVIQATEQNPDEIRTILLTSRPKDDVEVAGNSQRQFRAAYRSTVEPTSSPVETGSSSEETPAPIQVAVEPVPPPAATTTAGLATGGADAPTTVADLQVSPTPQTSDSNSSLNPSKVPAEMIEKLQSMYQQRLQLQENQKSKTEPAP